MFSNWFTGSTCNQSLGASFGRTIQIPTSVVSIADGAFGGYSGGPGYPSGPSGSAGSLSPSVYCEGTAADFAQIEIQSSGNANLERVSIQRAVHYGGFAK